MKVTRRRQLILDLVHSGHTNVETLCRRLYIFEATPRSYCARPEGPDPAHLWGRDPELLAPFIVASDIEVEALG